MVMRTDSHNTVGIEDSYKTVGQGDSYKMVGHIGSYKTVEYNNSTKLYMLTMYKASIQQQQDHLI